MVGEDHRTCVGGDIEHHVVQEERRKKQEERARTKTNAEQKQIYIYKLPINRSSGPILYGAQISAHILYREFEIPI